MAAVYQATDPVIRRGEIEAANETRSEVLQTSETFTEVTGPAWPQGVSEVYSADNGSGYVVRSSAKGYGGPVVFMIGIDNAGGIAGIQIFEHSETPGLGTKVDNPDYLAQYLGQTNPASVDAISGATRTSNALKTALEQALEAYELVDKEVP
jgi:electron transport complex protein RnfG